MKGEFGNKPMNLSIKSSFLTLTKIGLLFFLLIYIIFAFIVVKQVKLMTETLELGFEDSIRLIAFIHFIFSIIVFIVSLFIL